MVWRGPAPPITPWQCSFISTRGQARPKPHFPTCFWPAWRRTAASTCRKAGRRSATSAPSRALRYQDAAFTRFCRISRTGSFSDAELREAIEAAYGDFDVPDIAPLSGDRRGPATCWNYSMAPRWPSRTLPCRYWGSCSAAPWPNAAAAPPSWPPPRGDTGSAAIAALGRAAEHRCVRDASEGGASVTCSAASDDHRRPTPMSTTSRMDRQLRRCPVAS